MKPNAQENKFPLEGLGAMNKLLLTLLSEL